MKEKIEKLLQSFEFVRWDRYTHAPGATAWVLYGWIDRLHDEYKDFIVLTFWSDDEIVEYVTSSKEYDATILKILGAKNGVACQRIEHAFDISNSIKI